MKAISLLQEEEKILEEIIKFKTLRGTEIKYFETKKKLVNAMIKVYIHTYTKYQLITSLENRTRCRIR